MAAKSPSIAARPSAAQRLAFGRVADLYDRARPSYPSAAVDAVIEFGALAAPMRIVEVGAGTGKATVLFAARGLGVLGIEPSPEMARVARVNCARYPSVEIVETDFERWEPRKRFSALISVQAWHWIEPELRYEQAQHALTPGATLAAIWTVPDWRSCRLRDRLSAAYRVAAPELVPSFPMHPDSEPARLTRDWPSEVNNTTAFDAPVVQQHPWTKPYSAADYTALLQTHQDHILLEPERRTQLLEVIGAAIDAAGGTLAMPFVTYVCLARHQPSGDRMSLDFVG